MSVQLKRVQFKTTHPRKDSRRDLKQRADIQFSLFIRFRDERCIKCGSTSNLQCSHFHGRGNPALRLHPLNAHAMCQPCNQAHNEDRSWYREFYKRTYGLEALEKLDKLSREYTKFTDEELKDLTKTFVDSIEVFKDERSYL